MNQQDKVALDRYITREPDDDCDFVDAIVDHFDQSFYDYNEDWICQPMNSLFAYWCIRLMDKGRTTKQAAAIIERAYPIMQRRSANLKGGFTPFVRQLPPYHKSVVVIDADYRMTACALTIAGLKCTLPSDCELDVARAIGWKKLPVL